MVSVRVKSFVSKIDAEDTKRFPTMRMQTARKGVIATVDCVKK